MRYKELNIKGAYLITSDVYIDERGRFMRTYCVDSNQEKGINTDFSQGNLSINPKKATLRGFHYQISPHEEAKTLTCVCGSIFNVIIDLREDSPTYEKVDKRVIKSENAESIHVPNGCANAWITLENHTIIHYYMSNKYKPETGGGIRFDDKYFSIEWPIEPEVISKKDLEYEDYKGR